MYCKASVYMKKTRRKKRKNSPKVQTTPNALFGPVFVVVVSRRFVSITVVPIVLVDMISIEKKARKKKKHT